MTKNFVRSASTEDKSKHKKRKFLLASRFTVSCHHHPVDFRLFVNVID